MNNDLTLAEMIAALSDEALVTWWTAPTPSLPPDYTMAEFLSKILDACSVAAATKNEALEPGQKIVGYLPAVNGAVEMSGNDTLFFRRTASISTLVVVDLDSTLPAIG